MPEKFRRYFLKTKESKSIVEEVSEKIGVNLEQVFEGRVNFEVVETEFAKIFLINGKPLLAKTAEKIFPTLIFSEFLASMPKVVVDMGAVPHVCSGADVMAPGIVRFEGEFSKGSLVFVVDERHGKPIAIGEVTYDSEAAKKVSHGIVVKNIHFVGDKIWNFVKSFEVKV
ncbi:MAG: DUF1947 domain-containing protein [Candidatus Bathyarchaeia archaeon]